jgi:cytochrome c556
MLMRFTIVLVFAVFLFACVENTEKKDIACATEEKKTLDIYKDSELAVLMRAMHDAMEETKKSIEQGNENIEVSEFTSMLTAEPTDPNVKEAQFEDFANDYIKVVKVLNENQGNIKAHFNKSIDACIACHKAYCTGPIEKIKKLKIN